MSNPSQNGRPELAGYELIDKLGVGGYGEVYSARVPGGLTKAVKVIFGRHDESRAASELKSLERIREVRHPFVVSLERIEFNNNRLLVVSELADKSLRDRYRECVQTGLSGIPREELLRYLQDAADALDYLAEKHQLQHLDIKPENILLLAGHAKVADFGLVKAVGDSTQSLVGGMTPAYAPPEVFQGTPSRQSDQYSLAVLYQELLTGVQPFDGVNAAELTLQHLHDDPNLASLSEPDRFAVSRALSKNPENRFESCTAFVRALQSNAGFGESSGESAKSSPASANLQSRATEVFEEEARSDNRPQIEIQLPPASGRGDEMLDPPEFDAEGFRPTPSLFIGIGGTAALALRELRQKHSEKYEVTGPISTLPMLLLDTDPKSLSSATRNASRGAGLTPEETVSLQLRRPQEYRERSADLLRWLGRRWLYNIPKSLRTEGIRPLGRLALVDHARQAFQRIRRALTDCVSEESIRAALEATGAEFRTDAVRVYIVASASGGTGGGMAIDVAYAVRNLIARLDGVSDSKLIGVMTASTSRGSERGELPRVNAFSWISEHNHFCDDGHTYPGDASCGLPAGEQGATPFDSAYLSMFGSQLDDGEYAGATGAVADYLYVDSSTPGQVFLDACRDADGQAAAEQLRTFSVKRIEAAPAETRRAAEQLLVSQLVDSWLGELGSEANPEESAGTTSRVVRGAGEFVGRLKLDAVSLATMCRGIVESHLVSNGPPTPAAETNIERLEELNNVFQSKEDCGTPLMGEGAPGAVFGAPIADLVEPLLQRQQEELSNWIQERNNSPGERLAGAAVAVDWLREHVESLTLELHRFSHSTKAKLAEVIRAVGGNPDDSREQEARYLRLMMDYSAIEGAAQVVAGLRACVDAISEDHRTLRPAIAALSKQLRAAGDAGGQDPYELFKAVGGSPSRLVFQLDTRIQEDWLASHGDFENTMRDDALRNGLAAEILRQAHQVVREAVLAREPDTTGGDLKADWSTPELAEWCDGMLRLAVAPASAGESQEDFVCVSCSESDAYLITECRAMSAPHAAASLVDGRRDYAEFASRVHTRRDIEWKGLLPCPASAPTEPDRSFTIPVDVSPANEPAMTAVE